MEPVNVTTTKKAAKRRSMTPVRLLRALEAYIKTTDLDDDDTIESLNEAISASIVSEAINGR